MAQDHPRLVERLDHVVVVVHDIDVAITDYRALFARDISWRANDVAMGAATAQFSFPGTSLELLAPLGDGPLGARLRDILSEHGEGPASIAFETREIDAAHVMLERRGLAPDPIASGQSTCLTSGAVRRWRRTRANGPDAAGLKLFFLAMDPTSARPPLAPALGPACVEDLDHLVIQSADPQRAVALFGARLGLRLALDKTFAFGARLMFFRTGAMTIEIAHAINEGVSDKQDRLWGFSWRVSDVAGACDRLAASGFEVSQPRQGRKPGTTVATVRTRTHGCATILIGPG